MRNQQRRPKPSFANPQPHAPPPPPTPRSQYAPPRDSDASFASSRPSSAGVSRSSAASFELYKDHRFQSSAVATVNAYLSGHSPAISLRLPFPSAKDITLTLSVLLSRLDFPSAKLDDDLPLLLKSLNFPFKLNKSILKSPGTPHQWPTFLAIIHWLVQVAKFNDHVSSSTASFGENMMNGYALESYARYMAGDDEAVEAMDREWVEKMEREKESSAEVVRELERRAEEIRVQVETARAAPSRKEELEKERRVLEEDVAKFNEMIEKLREKIGGMERELEGKEKELGEKEAETGRVREENDGLRKRVEAQTVNSRDVERMRREMQAVERDIGDAEAARNTWEEKAWDLDATLGHKFNEIAALAMECNQAMRRLKLGDGFQYNLNAKGLTPAEVMGIDYKTTLKPSLESFAEDLKKNSMAKLEELISLQQQSSDVAAKIEGKRNHLAKLESHINELEAQLQLLRKETHDYTSRCAADAKKMMEDVELESHNLDTVEKEAADILKASKLKLEEAVKQSEEETQMCAQELWALVDLVTTFKEHVQSKLSEMRNDLLETSASISDAYKGSFHLQFGIDLDAKN